MRRFWKSTEFYLTLTIAGAFFALGTNGLSIKEQVLFVNGLVASYVIGRTLWKKNRGQFHSGILTSELYMVLSAEITNIYMLFQGLDPQTAWSFIGGMAALYNVARGFTKSIGVKTHFR